MEKGITGASNLCVKKQSQNPGSGKDNRARKAFPIIQ